MRKILCWSLEKFHVERDLIFAWSLAMLTNYNYGNNDANNYYWNRDYYQRNYGSTTTAFSTPASGDIGKAMEAAAGPQPRLGLPVPASTPAQKRPDTYGTETIDSSRDWEAETTDRTSSR